MMPSREWPNKTHPQDCRGFNCAHAERQKAEIERLSADLTPSQQATLKQFVGQAVEQAALPAVLEEAESAREAAHEAGWREAWVELLETAIGKLACYDDLVVEKARWIVDRERVVAALRRLCHEWGDNDWSVDLNLVDVIEKHLAVYLEGEDDE